MEIIDVGLEFNSNMSRMGHVNGIVLHHTGVSVPQSVEIIHNYHKSKGWAGIGYHYYVRKDGSVYKGRPEEYAGAHCPGVNSSSIGICAEGNFDKEDMSEKQEQSIIELIACIKEEYNIEYVKGHREILATTCPGSNYPLDEIRDSEPPQPSGDQQIRDIQQWLIDAYTLDIDVDGYYGPETKKAIIMAYQMELNAYWLDEEHQLGVDGIFGPATKDATPILKFGDEGDLVALVQSMLYCKGYNTNGVSGIYCNVTEVAVGNYQSDHRLIEDDIYGPETGYSLFN